MCAMRPENLIALKDFCTTFNVEISFITSLQQNGLIEISTIEEIVYIDAGQLQQLEKLLHFYYDLDINLEGIETITYLLKKIDLLQEEIISLRNRLLLYEAGE